MDRQDRYHGLCRHHGRQGPDEIVRQDGHRLFGDNCAACHGYDATGSKGFPISSMGTGCGAAIRKRWRKPSTSESTTRTKRRGLARCWRSVATRCWSPTPSRTSPIMFCRSPILPLRREEAGAIKAGKEVYTANCAVCHGQDGRSKRTPGAPNLADTHLDLWRRCGFGPDFNL